MTDRILTSGQIDDLLALIKESNHIAIVCHMTPDGDAMGSSLCLWHLLRQLQKDVDVVVPDMPPASLTFLPGADQITVASCRQARAEMLLRNADLIFCLDFNDLKRIDRMGPMLTASKARCVVIDHHLNPLIEADVIISHPEVSSTCALLYRVFVESGLDGYVDKDAAECCCTGMMTDTGNFSYNSNDPHLYTILAALVGRGVDKDALYTRLFNTNSESRVRLMGYGQSAKMQLLCEGRGALITLSRDELDEFDYHRGDTEALVNVPLSIPGVVFSIFLREDETDYVKVSMRSKGEFSVKELCEKYFGGGGHKNASGGEMRDSLSAAIGRVIDIVEQINPEQL